MVLSALPLCGSADENHLPYGTTSLQPVSKKLFHWETEALELWYTVTPTTKY